jgi:hypothetical protein
VIPDRLRLLIHDFQAGVRESLGLFQEHRGLDAAAVMCWRQQEELPQIGHIDAAGEIPYFFHGIGCCVHLPSGAVDWDFGHGGRSDGFDGWRLARFASERAGKYPEFIDASRVAALLENAEREGWVERFPERDHDTLYYLRASG